MRLNPDCIKDILLYLENNEQLIISPNDIIKRVEHNVPELQQYSFDDSSTTQSNAIYLILLLFQNIYSRRNKHFVSYSKGA